MPGEPEFLRLPHTVVPELRREHIHSPRLTNHR